MIIESKCFGGVKKVVSYCNNQPLLEGDIVQYVHAYDKFDNLNVGKTLLTDLSVTEDSLFSKMKAKTKNEIRRAEKEGMYVQMYSSNEITDDLIKSFAEAYIQFRTEKELSCPAKNELVAIYKAVRESGKLVLSEVFWDKQSVARHVYYAGTAERVAILHRSFSLYRGDNMNRQRIGNANRFLHWEDMKRLKGMGISILDWGGYNTEDEEVLNISRFKAEFGGVEKNVYSGETYRTLKGKIVRILLLVKRSLNERIVQKRKKSYLE